MGAGVTRAQALAQAVGVSVRRSDWPMGCFARKCDSGRVLFFGPGTVAECAETISGQVVRGQALRLGGSGAGETWEIV